MTLKSRLYLFTYALTAAANSAAKPWTEDILHLELLHALPAGLKVR